MENFNVDDYVISPEHPNSVGRIFRINEDGALSIEWVTAPREGLPFGSIRNEFWPVEDHHLLVVVGH